MNFIFLKKIYIFTTDLESCTKISGVQWWKPFLNQMFRWEIIVKKWKRLEWTQTCRHVSVCVSVCQLLLGVGMKTVQIFSDCIRDRIRLEGFRSVHIRVWIFNIRYCIRIWILKLYIYDVDIQSYLIRHDWHYRYSNPNPTKNMKTNMISVILVRIRSVFIPGVTSRL